MWKKKEFADSLIRWDQSCDGFDAIFLLMLLFDGRECRRLWKYRVILHER
jgi:hypothetical protein